MGDESASVRSFGVEALGEVTDRGDAYANALVRSCLSHEDPHTVQAAMAALSRVAVKGDDDAIRLASGCLDDGNPNIRRAAVDTLAEIVHKGDQSVIAALVTRVEQEYFNEVVRSTVKALAQIAGNGNKEVLGALMHRCKDADQLVRRGATEALGQMAERGDRLAIEAVSVCLGDKFQHVRQIGEKSDEQLIVKASRKLENRNDEFKMVAAV